MRTPIDTLDDLDRLHSRYTREAAVLISEAAAGDDDNQALRETIGGGEVIFIFNCAAWEQVWQELRPLK